jgi:hypothetical protein
MTDPTHTTTDTPNRRRAVWRLVRALAVRLLVHIAADQLGDLW